MVLESLENISLAQIAPPSIKYDKNVSAIIEALDPELKLIVNETQQLFILSRIDELDSGVLDLLAWQFHVDFYHLAEELPAKREQIKSSILWHMKKGTVWAILKALDMLGVNPKFINWHEFNGEPYTFKIDAEIKHDYHKYSNKDKIGENILNAIIEAKATRSYLAELKAYFKDSANTNIYVGMVRLENKDIVMEVDEATMIELLIEFEKRFFDAMAQHEAKIQAMIDEHEHRMNLQIEEILELLRWH